MRNAFIFVLCLQVSSEYIPFFRRALGYIFPLSTGRLHSVSLRLYEHVEKLLSLLTLKSVGFGQLLFFAVAVGFSRGLLLLVQAPCVTLPMSSGLVSQSWSRCCDNYGVVKPNLIRAGGFMAVAPVVAGAAQLQWFPLDPSGRATALLCCSMSKQYLAFLFVNL